MLAGTLLVNLCVHSVLKYMKFKYLTLFPFCAITTSLFCPGCPTSHPPLPHSDTGM